jgi:folate-binding protein YgfZ
MSSSGMSSSGYAILEARGVLKIEGPDTRPFLQGLISNDINKAAASRAIYATFLTPQGRYLHDFFIAEIGGALFLDCEAARLDDLKRRLSMFKLRSQVTIAAVSDAFAIAAIFGEGCASKLGLPTQAGAAKEWQGGVVFVDPRLIDAGARAILPRTDAAYLLEKAGFAAKSFADYDRLRLSLGLPDGSRDMPVEKAILLENGLDELNGIDWNKGCYLGQELTARTKHRGLVRKRLLPVSIEGPMPSPGTPVMAGSEEAGEMHSAIDGLGLAMLRLEFLENGGNAFTAGPARVIPRKPGWAAF